VTVTPLEKEETSTFYTHQKRKQQQNITEQSRTAALLLFNDKFNGIVFHPLEIVVMVALQIKQRTDGPRSPRLRGASQVAVQQHSGATSVFVSDGLQRVRAPKGTPTLRLLVPAETETETKNMFLCVESELFQERREAHTNKYIKYKERGVKIFAYHTFSVNMG
jgi:hypothetical protein